MSDNVSNVVIHTPGRIMPSVRMNETELREKIKSQRAFNPDVLETNPPVIFPVEISNNNVDSYYTIMAESTLRNFATDADTGVSVQDSHDTRSLGFGHSLTGRFNVSDTRMWVESEFYTVPGLSVRDGKKSDDYILGLNVGIYRDFSVGFHLGDEGIIRCNICGNDMMEWWGDCRHWPGEKYNVPVDPSVPDGPTVEKVALGVVENGRLSEYSPVYDGATPGAGVLKAERMIEAGELDARKARSLEVMYRHSLPGVREYWAVRKQEPGMVTVSGKREEENVDQKDDQVVDEPVVNPDEPVVDDPASVDPAGGDDEDMFEIVEDEDESTDEEEEEERIVPSDEQYYNQERARLAEKGLRLKDNPYRVAVALGDKVLELRADIKRMEAEAADGRAYRDDMIQAALDEGVRAHPGGFDREKFEALMRRPSTTLEDIRLMRNTWCAEGDKRFGQGRTTKEFGREVDPVEDDKDDSTFVDQP